MVGRQDAKIAKGALAVGTSLCTAMVVLISSVGAEEKRQQVGVDFPNDVLPVLTRAGCNAGACHGAALGQGGFKLSLRGSHPHEDWETITRALRGRRVDRSQPENSLVLQKPTEVISHGGGQVLSEDAPETRTLRRWLEAGAPFRTEQRILRRLEVKGREQLEVQAHYDDGSKRNVTRLALFFSNDDAVASVDADGAVTVHGPGVTALMVRYGGEVTTTRIERPFGPPRDTFPVRGLVDETYVAHMRRMGIDGGKPCSDRAFLRRAMLDVLGQLPTVEDVRAFEASPDRHKLIDDLIDRPAFARYWAYRLAELLGSHERLLPWLEAALAEKQGWDIITRRVLTAEGDEPPGVFFRVNNPRRMAENTFRSFLGQRLECAECHDHPFDRLRQDEYYGITAFFARTRLQGRRVTLVDRGEVQHPRTGKPVSPALLRGVTPAKTRDRRAGLAAWITSDNPAFARALVNRVWSLLMGWALVEPVDDMRSSNPPPIPDLLDALARDFAKNGYSIPRLVRTIVSSNTYRHAKRPHLMSAAVLLDALETAASGEPSHQAVDLPFTKSRELDASGRGRSGFQGSLAQALSFVSEQTVNARAERMADLDLETLYLRALSRPPRSEEVRTFARRAEKTDFIWALLNSREFVYVH